MLSTEAVLLNLNIEQGAFYAFGSSLGLEGGCQALARLTGSSTIRHDKRQKDLFPKKVKASGLKAVVRVVARGSLRRR